MLEEKEPQLKVNRSRREIFINNFIGGIGWSLGVIFGAGILIAAIGFFVSKIDFIPIIGNFVIQITEFVKQHQTNRLL